MNQTASFLTMIYLSQGLWWVTIHGTIRSVIDYSLSDFIEFHLHLEIFPSGISHVKIIRLRIVKRRALNNSKTEKKQNKLRKTYVLDR